MYRLMKSEKFTLEYLVAGSMSSYRQVQVGHFPHLRAALGACTAANTRGAGRYYVLNASGKEYYDGTWID
jgi:hypothetical protein